MELTKACQDQEKEVAAFVKMQQVRKDARLRFYCPLSLDYMLNPVIAEDGTTYDRLEIEEWFEDHNISPMTGKPIKDNLEPDVTLKNEIVAYQQQEEVRKKRINEYPLY